MSSPRGQQTGVAEHPTIQPGRRLVAIDPAADAFTALTMMRRNEVRHLPVVVENRCVGLLTESDLLRGLASGRSAAELTVGALCHQPAPAVPAGSTLQTMAEAMVADGADAALLVNRGVLVGMVTSTDVLGAVTEKWRDRTPSRDSTPSRGRTPSRGHTPSRDHTPSRGM
jgi:CBS domain-containing protein